MITVWYRPTNFIKGESVPNNWYTFKAFTYESEAYRWMIVQGSDIEVKSITQGEYNFKVILEKD